MGGGQQNTAKADAVVTNPVHIAVAIKYDEKTGGAPVVVAKGLRKNAERIKEIARENDVAILIEKDIYWRKGIWIKYNIYPWIQAF